MGRRQAPKSRRRYRGNCVRKKSYPDAQAASRAATRVERSKGYRMYPYRCATWGAPHWHIARLRVISGN